MLWVDRRRRSLSVVRRPLSSSSQNLLGQSLSNFVCIALSGEGNNLLLVPQSLGDLVFRQEVLSLYIFSKTLSTYSEANIRQNEFHYLPPPPYSYHFLKRSLYILFNHKHA